jgi:hypothetical protein
LSNFVKGGEGGGVHVNPNLSRVSERYHTKAVGKEIVAKPKIGMLVCFCVPKLGYSDSPCSKNNKTFGYQSKAGHD